MAVLKVKSSAGSVKDIRAYLEKEGRGVERTAYNVDDEQQWDKDMILTKMMYDKKDGRQYVWIVQSFEAEQEKKNYNEKAIHQMGKEIAEEFSKKGFQVVVITHNDTDNIHNHIIVNTVNSEDGRKIQLSNAKNAEMAPKSDFLLKDIYRLNDEICVRYGLNTLSESKERKTERERKEGKQSTTYKTDEIYIKNGYKERMRDALQRVFSDVDIKTKEDFYVALQAEQLSVTRITENGHITYQDADGHKVRARGLGAFDGTDVGKLLERNNRVQKQRIQMPERKRERGGMRR